MLPEPSHLLISYQVEDARPWPFPDGFVVGVLLLGRCII